MVWHTDKRDNETAFCTDSQLISRSRLGDQQAFTNLVMRYSPPLTRYIMSRLKGSNETSLTDDVLQHVWLRLFLHLPDISLEVPLSSWLFRVAHNCCIDILRAQRRRTMVSLSTLLSRQDEMEDDLSWEALVSSDASLSEQLEAQEEKVRIRRAIESLPAHFRQVVLLRYEEQMTFAEIGALLQMSSSTAKTYFYRSKAHLRRLLNGLEDAEIAVSNPARAPQPYALARA